MDTYIQTLVDPNGDYIAPRTKVAAIQDLAQYHDSAKQDKLTAGTNITIENNVISATGSLGTVSWGDIEGTLANQTDLQDELDAKQDALSAGDNVTITNNVVSALKYYKKSEVTGVAGTSTTQLSSTYDVSDADITQYYDGLVITFVLPVAGVSTYGSVFQINSLGYKPIVYATNSAIGTRYPTGGQVTMVYNSVQTAAAYLTKNTKTTITGCWQICDYDTSTTDARRVFDYYFRPYAAETIYRYKLCALDKDNRIHPITITNQESTTQVAKVPTSAALKTSDLWMYTSSSSISANKVIGSGSLATTHYSDGWCAYNFNASIPTYRMIYLRGTYDKATGLFTLYNDGSSPCTSYYTVVPNNTANITLSSYFTAGYYYWLVGSTYSTADYLQVFGYNPLYYFDGTNLIPYQEHLIAEKISEPASEGTNGQVLTTDGSGGRTWTTIQGGVADVKMNGTSIVSSGAAMLTSTASPTESGTDLFTSGGAYSITQQIPDVIDNVTSTDTDNSLSANQGKLLNDRIDNLSNIGRYLALWDCSTGLPTTNPGTLPYTYKSGDYYRVSKISVTYTHNISLWHGNATKSQAITTLDLVITNFSETPFTTATLQQYFIDNGYTSSSKIYPCTGLCGEYSPAMDFDGVISWAGTHFDYYSGTSRLTGNAVSGHYISDNIVVNSLINYKPNGDSYSGVTSTTQESNAVAVGDVYFYDGTTWSLQINHLGAFVEDVQIAGTSIVSSGVANIITSAAPTESGTSIFNTGGAYTLQQGINTLENRGQYLNGWNAGTGLPVNLINPYTYKAGDIFKVTEIGSATYDNGMTDTVTNIPCYRPVGSSYNGIASTTTEPGSVTIGDTYLYDGTSWTLQINHEIPVNIPVIDVTVDGTSVVTSGTASIIISGKENTSNKVTSLSSSSTDAQYPSAKCVYDMIGNVESLLEALL